MREASKMEKGDFEAAEKLLNLLFGKKQAEEFLSHLDDGDDFIDTEVLFADIKSIFESNKDLKNLSPCSDDCLRRGCFYL
ncbi:phage protein [Streptococcus pneumoniae 2070335]|nr:phage protein [Streptococcus pneumoniae 2070335]